MSAENETITGIANEIRARAVAWSDEMLKQYDLRLADRIEAAAKGNAAALREALTEVSKWVAHRIATGGFEASPTIPTVLEDVVLPALSAPSRECDRFTDEKQADALHAAFIEYCNGCDCPMGCIHRKDPRFLLDGNCASILKCFARFALSKATPKEGGAS